MQELDAGYFHRLYGVRSPRMTYQRTDFIDYTLMNLICAVVLAAVYGANRPMSIIGYGLCAFMIATFIPRHRAGFKLPVLLRRPQDVLYMLIYKIQNLKPVWILAVGLLLLENIIIFLTPHFPHHVELTRQVAIVLFYIHFVSVSIYRTVTFIAHLRKKELVREVLLQTNWRGLIEGRRSIVLEIVHAYFTGILTHMVLIAPWYVVITHVRFSVVLLPIVCFINVLLQLKFFKTFNEWFYRDHWLGHNCELEFIYLHGSHHDAIPSGMIGVAGNGHLEGLLRHTFGYITPFFNPLIAFAMYSLEIKGDIDNHQYIPGIFPQLPKKFHELNQHSMHHMGSIEPYGIGLNFDQPQVTEELKKATRLPREIMDSIKLDERLTGYQWDTKRFRNYLALVDKYQPADSQSASTKLENRSE